MLDTPAGRQRVRTAAKVELARLGWSLQELINRSGLDRKTVKAFLDGDRWPQAEKRSKIEAAFGWKPGTISRLLDGLEVPGVGAGTQDADYVAAPGDLVEQDVSNAAVLAEVRAMREDLNAVSRRVARLESRPEPMGGADGSS
jgi:lambda repressor-like predicted transcriptional regulator